MPHSPSFRERAMRGAYAGSLTIALLPESSDPGYKRQPLTVAFNGGIATNSNEVRFGPWEADAKAPLTGWAIFDGETELVRDTLTRAKKPERGEVAVFPVGEFVDEMGA